LISRFVGIGAKFSKGVPIEFLENLPAKRAARILPQPRNPGFGLRLFRWVGCIECVEEDDGIDEYLSPVMKFVPGHTLGGVDGRSRVTGQTLPLCYGPFPASAQKQEKRASKGPPWDLQI
jgi:hypothetical protein